MTGWKRWFYHNMGWVYDPTETTEETKRQRHELMVQIKSFNDNIQTAVLKEEGEIPIKIKATRCPTPTIDYLDGTECDAPKSISEYTALFEGFDIPPKRKKKRKKNSNKLNF
jgi:hypothetical protein